jgi:hypothetical protein
VICVGVVLLHSNPQDLLFFLEISSEEEEEEEVVTSAICKFHMTSQWMLLQL